MTKSQIYKIRNYYISTTASTIIKCHCNDNYNFDKIERRVKKKSKKKKKKKKQQQQILYTEFTIYAVWNTLVHGPLKFAPGFYSLVRRKWGWSGGAMVLDKLPVPGRPTILITVGQGPIALAVGAGGGGLDIFTLICPFSSFSLSLGDGPI